MADGHGEDIFRLAENSPRENRTKRRAFISGRNWDRTIRVSAEKGLELNGKRVNLNGGCVHHDNGALGAMAFDRAEERKIELLKQAIPNAIRVAILVDPSPAALAHVREADPTQRMPTITKASKLTHRLIICGSFQSPKPDKGMYLPKGNLSRWI
jgi:hypothetical protein